MISEEVVFHDSLGINLAGILSRPSEGYDMPVVIACHGSNSSKYGMTYNFLEYHLIQEGIAILRFDFYGHGESGGDFEDITLSKSIDSVIQAFALLKQKGFKDFALFGTSFGGCTVLNASLQLQNELKCIACKCPVSDYTKQIERKLGKEGMKIYKDKGYRVSIKGNGRQYKLRYAMYEDTKKYNIHSKGKDIDIPVLIVHGDIDESVLLKQSLETQKIIPDCTLEIIKGVGHSFMSPNGFNKNPETYKHFIPFFTTHLLPNG